MEEQFNNTIKEKLKLYHSLDKEMAEKGGIEKNPELFEQITKLEENILSSFGLPYAQMYSEILWTIFSENELSDSTLEILIAKLHDQAKSYLNSDALTEIKILFNAQVLQLNYFNVLPEMKIPTTTYTIFVYNKLMEHEINADEAFKEMVAANNEEVLDNLGKLSSEPDMKNSPYYSVLKEYNRLNFLDEFIEYIKEERKKEEEDLKAKDNKRFMSFFWILSVVNIIKNKSDEYILYCEAPDYWRLKKVVILANKHQLIQLLLLGGEMGKRVYRKMKILDFENGKYEPYTINITKDFDDRLVISYFILRTYDCPNLKTLYSYSTNVYQIENVLGSGECKLDLIE